MTAELFLTLPRDSSAARVARRAVDSHIGGALDPRRDKDIELAVSELVTNAVLHGEGAITLRLQLDGEVLRGELADEGGGFEPAVHASGADDIGGRGPAIVEAVATRWGIHEGTTHVWFELGPAGPERASPELGLRERPPEL